MSMPEETTAAVEWALHQSMTVEGIECPVVGQDGEVDQHLLTHFVREYFNTNKVVYSSFSAADLLPYLEP